MRNFFKIDISRTIPSLDGLRAISIILVVVSHIAICIYEKYAAGFSKFQSIVQSLFVLGHLGVTIFFVISGFLITTILLREKKIDLKSFYFRRFLRIFPPFYFYLLVLFVIAWINHENDYYNFFAAMTYTRNYLSSDTAFGTWTLGHTWSLSVEEQFYIIFPVLFLISGRKLGIIFISFVILLCPLIRFIRVLHDGGTSIEFTTFETVADSLAVGCLLAEGREWLHTKKWYRYLLFSPVAGFVPLAIILLSWMGKFPVYIPKGWYVLIGLFVQNILIAFYLDRAITKKDGIAVQVLNARPMVYIGAISYSIYLWQQLFIDPSWDLPVYLQLAFTFLAAYGSYIFIERPSLQLRKYLENRQKKREVVLKGAA